MDARSHDRNYTGAQVSVPLVKRGEVFTGSKVQVGGLLDAVQAFYSSATDRTDEAYNNLLHSMQIFQWLAVTLLAGFSAAEIMEKDVLTTEGFAIFETVIFGWTALPLLLALFGWSRSARNKGFSASHADVFGIHYVTEVMMHGMLTAFFWWIHAHPPTDVRDALNDHRYTDNTLVSIHMYVNWKVINALNVAFWALTTYMQASVSARHLVRKLDVFARKPRDDEDYDSRY